MSDTFIDWSREEGRQLMPGSASWAATGEQLQVVLTTIQPGHTFPPHSHPHEQFCVVLEGAIEFDVEGKGRQALGPRGVFHFAAHEVHGARVVGSEPVTILEAFHPIRDDYLAGAADIDHDVPR